MNNSIFTQWQMFKTQEAQIIRLFKEAFPQEWEANIGNDCAVLQPLIDKKQLLTHDLLVEGVHFFPHMPLDALAYKALMVNISDICADGGTPQYFLLGIILPQNQLQKGLQFAKEIIKVAQQLRIPIIGGDTVKGQQFSISVTCIGEVYNPWLRKNARVGQNIYVSGSLGLSAMGFNILKQTQIFHNNDPFIKAHCYPPCRISLVKFLQQNYHITSATDISDGLIEDLTQILLESNVSCNIDIDAIFIDKGVAQQAVFFGGEDYELIFTTDDRIDIENVYENTGVKISLMGKIEKKTQYEGEIILNQEQKNRLEQYKKQKYFHF